MKTTLNYLAVLSVFGFLFTSARAAEAPALKDVFTRHFKVGAALSPRQFAGGNPDASKLVAKHFNTVTPENVMKWEPIHPREDGYDFDAADKFVAFGESKGMFIVGHTLVWHQQTPQWVFKKDGADVDRETLLSRMREHIRTVVGRYKGRVNAWDVVNEALEENGELRQSQWLKIIGPDYISKAFEFAREADPGAELYYNDYSLENAPKRKGALKLLRDLQAKGIKVHAVGLQGHYKMDWPSPALLEETIKDFKAIGLNCMITELDVDVLPSRRGASADISMQEQAKKEANPYPDGLPEEKQRDLAKRYAELFTVLVRNGDSVDRVTFWGVTDGDSWLNYWPIRGRMNYPLLFDREGRPKPAFEAVIKTAKK
jgi:endo-1,4-beta-xylanase